MAGYLLKIANQGMNLKHLLKRLNKSLILDIILIAIAVLSIVLLFDLAYTWLFEFNNNQECIAQPSYLKIDHHDVA